MGARADHWPSETRTVTPYVAEQFPQGFREASCPVKVLSVESTFWEKATILHAEFHRPPEKPLPARFSRHYCDFYEIIRKGVAVEAVRNLELLDRVAKPKSLFFRSSWARFDEATKRTLRLSPSVSRTTALREDYEKMREMFFGDPPDFVAMLTALQDWESQFNRK
jgi:hypothetical protein